MLPLDFVKAIYSEHIDTEQELYVLSDLRNKPC
jgi:hypothetical protein